MIIHSKYLLICRLPKMNPSLLHNTKAKPETMQIQPIWLIDVDIHHGIPASSLLMLRTLNLIVCATARRKRPHDEANMARKYRDRLSRMVANMRRFRGMIDHIAAALNVMKMLEINLLVRRGFAQDECY